MVDRLAVGQEEVRFSSLHSLILSVSLTDWLQVTRNGLSKVKAGRRQEIKQEVTGSVIQALSEANRELSDREHDHILEEEVTRRRRERALVRRPSYHKILTDLSGNQNMISGTKKVLEKVRTFFYNPSIQIG